MQTTVNQRTAWLPASAIQHILSYQAVQQKEPVQITKWTAEHTVRAGKLVEEMLILTLLTMTYKYGMYGLMQT